MLQVGIEDDGTVAGGIVKSRQHGSLFAKVAREYNGGYSWILFYQSVYDTLGIIITTVIDKEYFPIILFERVDKLAQVAV